MSKLNYKTSKDYKRLKELLDKGEALIVIVRRFEEEVAILRRGTMGEYEFTGFCDEVYYPTSMHSFAELCDGDKLEFIEPNGEE